MKRASWTRRDLLRLGTGALVAVARPLAAQVPTPAPSPSPSPSPTALPVVPRVNGAINIQPVRRFDPTPGTTPPLIVPDLVDLQMRELYELGFEAIRITISYNSFGPDFLAAIPYVRAARALGMDVLGVMSDFSGFDLAQALRQRTSREQVLSAYVRLFAQPVPPASAAVKQAGRVALQVLNEPTHFLGIAPEAYVREFLTPVYDSLKQKAPGLTVVSAAELGNNEGVLRLRAMLSVGLEQHCDRVGCHIYNRSVIPLVAGLPSRPVWVTESGIAGPHNQLAWVTDVFEEIRRTIVDAERIFYFVLYDAGQGGFRLIDIVPDGSGFRPLVASPDLYAFFATRAQRAAEGVTTAAYADLVPDITAYFPSQADLDLIAESALVRR